jgi:hypothetical protein
MLFRAKNISNNSKYSQYSSTNYKIVVSDCFLVYTNGMISILKGGGNKWIILLVVWLKVN